MVQSSNLKSVISKIRAHYRRDWKVAVNSLGLEVERKSASDVVNHIFYNVVQDNEEGVRLQPSAGVTYLPLRNIRDALLPRHEHTIDVVSGLVFLNFMIPPEEQQPVGWLFESVDDIEMRLNEFLDFVDRKIAESGFFESLRTINSYVDAIENNKWSFWGVMPEYLYALIYLGEIERAKKIAREEIEKNIAVAEARGLVFREEDVESYAAVASMK